MTNLIVIEHLYRDLGEEYVMGVASSMNNAINMRTKFLNTWHEGESFEIIETIGCKDFIESTFYTEIYKDEDGFSGSVNYTRFIINYDGDEISPI
jgi:hypothetical protein